MKDLIPKKVKIAYKDGKEEEFDTIDWWTIGGGVLLALKLKNCDSEYNYYAIPTADISTMLLKAEEVEI